MVWRFVGMANVSDPAAEVSSCGVAAVADGAVLSSVFPEQAMKERARAAARSLRFISIPFGGVGAASGAGFYDETGRRRRAKAREARFPLRRAPVLEEGMG